MPPKQSTGEKANASFGSVTGRSGRRSSQHDAGTSGAAKNMGKVNTEVHRKPNPFPDEDAEAALFSPLKRSKK